jgi:predicted RNase H-like HicB family nuclease
MKGTNRKESEMEREKPITCGPENNYMVELRFEDAVEVEVDELDHFRRKRQILSAKRRRAGKKYAIVIQRTAANYAAHLPDLPGCVATGETIEAAKRMLLEAIKVHVAGLREDGLAVPEPASVVDYVELPA